MENQNWNENITEEQKRIMEILGGFLSNITSLMNVMTKDMQPRKAYLYKLAYLEALGNSLKLDEENQQ